MKGYLICLFIFCFALHSSHAIFCNAKNCADCVTSTGNCRWCPRSNRCHMPGEIATNVCSRAENIVEISHCSDQLPKYDTKLAEEMLLLSAVAYDSIDVQECLNNALSGSGYTVQKTADTECGNPVLGLNSCFSYLAVSHSKKVIALAYRGSVGVDQVLQIFLSGLVTPKAPLYPDDPVGGEVQIYFYEGFVRSWKILEPELKSLLAKYPSYKVYTTGHSLGATMASIAAAWVSYRLKVPRQQLFSYTFGSPRVGSYKFALHHDMQVNNSWRVVNYRDPVVHFPSLVSMTIRNGPYHHGVEVFYKPSSTSSDSDHKECHGKPFNEDASCSFSVLPDSIKDHTHYFGIEVGHFWESKCKKNEFYWKLWNLLKKSE